MRLIETEDFPFEFLSQLAERESWRKEVHRPVYHVHKWWAKRLGSIFRGILLGCLLPAESDLEASFYRPASFPGTSVFDPFMGSGTTVGEAHKLGLTALGRDINPVAVAAVRTALGPLDRACLEHGFEQLSAAVGGRIRELYRAKDSVGRSCEVLYYFWTMQAACPACSQSVDLLSSWIIARNAYPARKPQVQVLCPACGDIFAGLVGDTTSCCPSCAHSFDPHQGPASGQKATCTRCCHEFRILDAIGRTGNRPGFRLYGKLVLTSDGSKEYLPANADDHSAYLACSDQMHRDTVAGTIHLPDLALEAGYNTGQAMGYGFRNWRDFFNDRQLLALSWLRSGILNLPDPEVRSAFLTLFSGTLEFNNLFASYKGEGTGAVRHMFSHHILKPERAPIEANVWGTPKSSGAFSGLFKSRLLRAASYRERPVEVGGHGSASALPFSGELTFGWPSSLPLEPGTIHLSCGDSSRTGLPEGGLDLVVTDPPFFDNVHYSELADFFYAWQQIGIGDVAQTTRSDREVQDGNAAAFTAKLQAVLAECNRVLKGSGLLVFTYHHSRSDGWQSVAAAILGAGFTVVSSHPVKAEMSSATPKSQAKEPIQLDIVIVCRKVATQTPVRMPSATEAAVSAWKQVERLRRAGFVLSRNDCKVALYGQLLTTLRSVGDADNISSLVNQSMDESYAIRLIPVVPRIPKPDVISNGNRLSLFEDE